MITDDLGRSIPQIDRAERVVSLAPGATELAFAAGMGSQLVAVTTADNYPPAVQGLERISALPLNHEAIVALEPDLILASDQINDPREAEALAEVGIPTYFVSVGSLPDVSRVVRALGVLFGDEVAAGQYADSLEATLQALDTSRRGDADRPSVIFLIGDDTLFSFGPESYVHDMILVAGGRSLTAEMSTEAPVLSEEFVLAAQPEVLLTAFDPDPARLVELHPGWEAIPAIRDGRVFRIEPDLVLRDGPRLIAGTLAMRRALTAGS